MSPRWSAVVLLTIASLATAGPTNASAQARATTSERPHVLFIVIDTLRADHLSSYGYERPTSPHLDRLASEGVLYENCISPAPWTLPSHASLFTGLYPREHETNSGNWLLNESIPTMAEHLADAGYRTAGFSNNVWLNDGTGLQRGFDHFEEMWKDQKSRGKNISLDDPAIDMAGRLTNERVLSWIDAEGASGPEPFFVFINFFEPHLPYRPTQPYDDDFLPENADPETVRRLRSFYSPREYGYILRFPTSRVSALDLEVLTSLYDGEIAYTDSLIGELTKALEERGLLDDTLLIVTSDHGEHLGENHMLDHKFSVYDPLLRVPMILRHPGLLPAGQRLKTQAQSHHVFGTVLGLTGLSTDRPSLPTEEKDGGFTFAELAYPQLFLDVAKREMAGYGTKPFERALETARGDRYKIIRGSDGSVELYDLEEDPREEHDLATEQPELVEQMIRALDSEKAFSSTSRVDEP